MTRAERRIIEAAREKAMVLAIERDIGLFILDAKKRFEDHSMSAIADSVSHFRDIMEEDRPKEDLKLLEQYRRFVVEQLAHGTDSTRLITYQKLDEEHARSIRPTASESGLAILRDWLSTNMALLSG